MRTIETIPPIRPSVALAVLFTAGACASPLQRGLRYYEHGHFVQALDALDSESQDPVELELRALVEEGIDYSSGYLARQARAYEAQAASGPLPYREALAFYEASLASMSSDDSRRKALIEAMSLLDRKRELIRKAFDDTLDEFRAARHAGDQRRALVHLQRLVELHQSGGGDPPAVVTLLDMAREAASQDAREQAAQFVSLADQVRRTQETQIDVDNLAHIARVAASMRFLAQKADEQQAALDAEAQKAEPPPRARSLRSKRRHHKPTPKAVETPEVAAAAAAEAAEQKERVLESREAVKRAEILFAAGKKFEAIRLVDQALIRLGNAVGTASLLEKRRGWRPEREALIESYVRSGEEAIAREQSTVAIELYRKVLVLESSHEVARDRVRKLEQLRKLQAGGSGN